jgi:hypothetical protein
VYLRGVGECLRVVGERVWFRAMAEWFRVVGERLRAARGCL